MNIHDLLSAQINQEVRRNVILAPYTTFKIGGPAEFFIEAQDKEAIIKAVQACVRYKIPYYILGGGSNILIKDQGVEGLVIRNLARKISVKGLKGVYRHGFRQGKTFIEAESGTSMNQLVRYTIESGLGGLEMHLGLPGTVGGAIFMNSKWMKSESYVGDRLIQGEIMDTEGKVRIEPASYFNFGYDTSILQKTGEILLSAVFELTPKEQDLLWISAQESLLYRKKSQPVGVKTAGCIFRNFSKAEALTNKIQNNITSAGFLIDKAGLKGKSSNEAVISDIHANFILNRGQASASDVLELIALVKNEVYKKFGITLKEEILIFGRK